MQTYAAIRSVSNDYCHMFNGTISERAEAIKMATHCSV